MAASNPCYQHAHKALRTLPGFAVARPPSLAALRIAVVAIALGCSGAAGSTARATEPWIDPACEAWRDTIEQTAGMLRRQDVLTERTATEILFAAYDLKRRCTFEPSQAILRRFSALMTLLEAVADNGQD